MKFKKLLVIVSLFWGLASAYADNSWKTDFEAALAEAKSQNRYVLVNFTGSDWCGWCIKLDKEVFSQGTFKQFAADKLVLVEIDFPRKDSQPEELKAQNEKLAKKHGVRGFPTILVLSPDGELVGKTGYKASGAKAYVAHLEEIIGQ